MGQKKRDKDIFMYSGPIERGCDLKFINKIKDEKDSDTCLIIMTSNGGNPDAAYKMAKYLQIAYDDYSVLIPGLCKSAATLFVLGAKELIFGPYGELGPLDIQFQKEDKLFTQESGLNIMKTLELLEKHTIKTFDEILISIFEKTRGVISFETASNVATKMISALYGPIYSQIDPSELGARARDMKICEHYAKNLNIGNLKNDSLRKLISEYPSHSFVIDYSDAEELFETVRQTTKEENELLSKIPFDIHFSLDIPKIEKWSEPKSLITDENENEKHE